MATRQWKTPEGTARTEEEVLRWIVEECEKTDFGSDYELIVGVDSHRHGNIYHFSTVVCLYRKGRGGYYFHATEKKHAKEFRGSYPACVKNRMFFEADLATTVANAVFEATGRPPVIHLDVSPPEAGEVTSVFADQIRGFVTAYGFEPVIKPWSFCASGIANRHTKVGPSGKQRKQLRRYTR